MTNSHVDSHTVFATLPSVVPCSPRREQPPRDISGLSGFSHRQNALCSVRRADPAHSLRSALKANPHFIGPLRKECEKEKKSKSGLDAHEAPNDFAFSSVFSSAVPFSGAAGTEQTEAIETDAKSLTTSAERRDSVRHMQILSQSSDSLHSFPHLQPQQQQQQQQHALAQDDPNAFAKRRRNSRRRTSVDDPFLLRVQARERRQRRKKKDAPSAFSVMLPVLDEDTHEIKGERVFPRSVRVEDAIRCVLERERGEMRTRTSGLAIRDFLANFSESQEMVLVYFWFIVVHMRRVRSEAMLIGRFANLERAFHLLFPRHRADLPPLVRLEEIMADTLRTMARNSGGSAISRGVSAASASGAQVSDDRAQNMRLSSRANVSVSSTSRAVDSRLGKSVHSRHGTTDTDLNAWVHDLNIVLQFADAVDEFIVMQTEINELAVFAQGCFFRLAVLFCRAFERVKQEKDEVFSTFVLIISHVVYFMLVYCFPNDDLADMFNGSFRASLYRIFFFWSSGLFATYVRVNDWPSPLHITQSSPPRASMESVSVPRTLSGSATPLHLQESRELFDIHGALKDSSSLSNEKSLSLGCFSKTQMPFEASTTRVTPALGETTELSENTLSEHFPPLHQTPKALGDTGFDDVDVEVANGHIRLITEFNRYTKHVNYLVDELKQRAEEMPVDDLSPVRKPAAKLSPPRKSTAKRFSQPSLPTNRITLPPLVPRRRSSKLSGGEALSRSPVRSAAPRVRQFILHRARAPPVDVPLPPLFVGESVRDESPKGAAKKNVFFVAERSRRVPLPAASPFFYYYAQAVLRLDIAAPAESRAVFSGADSFCKRQSQSPSEAPPGRRASVGKGITFQFMECVNKSPGNAAPPSAPSQSISRLSSRAALGKQLQRGLKVMVIPPADARLRPLQFKGLTREVERRQRDHEMQIEEMVTTEQQMRHQYDYDSQKSSRQIHTLLLAAEKGRVRKKGQLSRGVRQTKKMQ